MSNTNVPRAGVDVLISNVTCTVAATEYPATAAEAALLVPAGTTEIHIRAVDPTHTLRIAFETGKVATPTVPYYTITDDKTFELRALLFYGKVLYVASPDAGAVAQIIAISTTTTVG